VEGCVLVVDDEPGMLEVLSMALEEMGFRALVTQSPERALEILRTEEIELALLDVRMPQMDGRELMQRIKEIAPRLPVVFLTAFGNVKDAVSAIKVGAFDYLTKPFNLEDLQAVLARGIRYTSLLKDNERLREALEGRYSFKGIIGTSPKMRAVIEAISKVCESNVSVLILGESGTGKELVARAVHFNSPRKDGPFLAINCAAIPEGLLESELFGYVKGAFTGATGNKPGKFAQANKGTLFLDEIGDMPLGLQSRILRVLQERAFEPLGSGRLQSVDVRIVAATNKNLKAMVQEGAFREDLYFRLNVYPIQLPPLRERKEDIPQLASHFLAQSSEAMGRRIKGLTPSALEAMARYRWPGNVRELINCIERAVIVSQDAFIDVSDLPEYLFERKGSPQDPEGFIPENLDRELERIERGFILRALEEAQGIQAKAAKMLGIQERSLWHRIKKLGIRVQKNPTG
jgi:DNA-binding NtrC family response regulator